LWVRVVSTSASHNNDFQYEMEFDGERRSFARSRTINSNETLDKVLFDGKEVTLYNDSGISLYNLGSEQGHVVVDPRILGLTCEFTGTERLDWFKYGSWKDCKAEITGADEVDGLHTWHVRMGDADCVFNWWIDEKNGFRVYRYVEEMGKMGHNEIRSYYNENYPWLPTNSVLQRFNEEGSLIGQVSITIFKSQADVKFPDTTWTLAGMRIPSNDIPVTDLRISKVIGFWNGQRIRPASEPAPRKPYQPVPPQGSPKRSLFIIIMLIVFFGPLGWMIVAQMKKKQ
jgi:hypothetical protein